MSTAPILPGPQNADRGWTWKASCADFTPPIRWLAHLFQPDTLSIQVTSDRIRDLFDNQPDAITKIAGTDAILRFFLERLRTVFPHVIDEPMILYNSHNSPMYALCFAAGNPKGGATALKIASHLARTR